MSLATLNNNFYIPYATIAASRPNYKYEVNAMVNTFMNAWLKPRPYINLTNKYQKISDADMKVLSTMIQDANNKWVLLSTRLLSTLTQYFKNNPASIKAFVLGGDTKFTWSTEYGNKNMMWFLAQSQIIADAAAIINATLAGKTTYKVG